MPLVTRVPIIGDLDGAERESPKEFFFTKLAPKGQYQKM